ncbi:MAG: DUF559 domain-containing protein [Roseiarcus sp.]|uniref:endonuclease domain-containing protein n=1 Tax=Roseiarcus sp. TaxID=1969460 RepID=UPI003C3CB758
MRGSQIPETRRARVLRQSQTHAEASLWRALRGRGLDGLKFVRQEPIGPYFADFVCRDKRLVVEIDGATHSTDEDLRGDSASDRVSPRARLPGRPLRKRGRLSEY